MVIGIVARMEFSCSIANQKFLAFGFAPEEAMIQAGRRRLRPIVMTAMAAVAGMFHCFGALGARLANASAMAIAGHRPAF